MRAFSFIDHSWRRVLLVACLAFAGQSHAEVVEEIIAVPVKLVDRYGKAIAHEVVVTVYHDKASAPPYPVLVINHGRPIHATQRAAMGRINYRANAHWFARQGFLVAVPTRIGYGITGGDNLEDSGSCGQKNHTLVNALMSSEILQILTALRKRDDALQDRSVIVGQSFGGMLSIAIAAQNPPGVQAIINFAGGAGGNPVARPQDPCSTDQLSKLFGDYGSTARVPSLWLYAQNDQWFGPIRPQEWFAAFKATGGTGEFVLMEASGKDGHSSFVDAPEHWRARVLRFLRDNGFRDMKPDD